MLNFQHLNSHEPFFLKILIKVGINYNLSSSFIDKILMQYIKKVASISPFSFSMWDKNLQEL